MNRSMRLVGLWAAIASSAAAPGCHDVAECESVVVPRPSEVRPLSGHSLVSGGLSLSFATPDSVARPLEEWVRRSPLPVAPDGGSAASAPGHTLTLELSQGATLPASAEGYHLRVHPAGISVRSRGAAGLFYGLQTLLALYERHGDQIPAQEITDSPRFGWRGLHLDVSRHFFDKEFVKKQMRMMARLKLNRLHLHLTDAAGWRLEVGGFPELTEVGAWREGATWREWEEGGHRQSRQGAEGAYGGFFSRADVEDIVATARSLHIEVVPEIEFPGHSEEVLASMPDLACRGGVAGGELCLGNERSFEVVEGVLSEVLRLFPSEYVHIGGDEAGHAAWEACPLCRGAMLREGLGSAAELQGWGVRRLGDFLARHGRRMVGWDETLEGGLAPGAVVMSWRGEEGGRRAAAMGHDVVMTPGAFCYLDSYQDNPTTEPLAMSGYLPLPRVYSYDPAPPTMEGRERVLGVQANLWTEHVETEDHAEYMLYPRLFALAEVAWSAAEGKNYSDFHRRALWAASRARTLGYNTFDLTHEQGERHESLRPDNHRAVGCPVAYKTAWNSAYPAEGAQTLTNGLRGPWSYKTRWQGFLGTGVDVTVDLRKTTDIGEVAADFVQWHSAWIWMPERVSFYVSEDSTDFRLLHTAENGYPPDERRPAWQTFGWRGRDRARYVRMVAEAGKRQGGWLFTDEIRIN